MESFQIFITKQYGINSDERFQKLQAAKLFASMAVNSEEFKTWFFSFPFTQLELSSDSRKSTLELYTKLMRTARFVYYVGKRPWYKRLSDVLGFTNKFGVHTYSDVYDHFSVAQLAGHLVHESCHVLGYSHTEKWNFQRDNSVAYAVGYFVDGFKK